MEGLVEALGQLARQGARRSHAVPERLAREPVQARGQHLEVEVETQRAAGERVLERAATERRAAEGEERKRGFRRERDEADVEGALAGALDQRRAREQLDRGLLQVVDHLARRAGRSGRHRGASPARARRAWRSRRPDRAPPARRRRRSRSPRRPRRRPARRDATGTRRTARAGRRAPPAAGERSTAVAAARRACLPARSTGSRRLSPPACSSRIRSRARNAAGSFAAPRDSTSRARAHRVLPPVPTRPPGGSATTSNASSRG